jgi:hypothetical protein
LSARDLAEYDTRVHLRPDALRVHPIQIVVDLDQQNRIERAVAQVQVLEINGAVLDVGQPAVGDSCLPAVVAPVLVSQIVWR